MKKNIPYFILAAILLIIVIFLFTANRKKETEKVCYDLPLSADPKVFGPPYWASFHDLAHRVPCPECRSMAEEFMVFFHDVVNKKLAKPTYDQDNYDKVKAYVNSLS